jgi:hypothetical protein
MIVIRFMRMLQTKKHTLKNVSGYWAILTMFLNGVPEHERKFLALPRLLAPVTATKGQRDRVLKLILRFKELEALCRDRENVDPSLSEEFGYPVLKKAVSAARKTLVAEINQILSKYPSRRVVSDTSLETPYFRVHPQIRKPKGSSLRMTEADAIAMVSEMASLGILSYLRQCEFRACGKWFIASRIDRRFCSAPCKRRHQASSSEFKKQRREYMRERYRLEKENDAKNLEILKGGGRADASARSATEHRRGRK